MTESALRTEQRFECLKLAVQSAEKGEPASVVIARSEQYYMYLNSELSNDDIPISLLPNQGVINH